MAIQGAINSMLGTAAGAMTAVVAKAKMFDNADVSNQANQRAKTIYSQKRQRKNNFGQTKKTKQLEVNK